MSHFNADSYTTNCSIEPPNAFRPKQPRLHALRLRLSFAAQIHQLIARLRPRRARSTAATIHDIAVRLFLSGTLASAFSRRNHVEVSDGRRVAPHCVAHHAARRRPLCYCRVESPAPTARRRLRSPMMPPRVIASQFPSRYAIEEALRRSRFSMGAGSFA